MNRFWLILAVFLGLASTAVPASAALVFTLNCDNNGCGNAKNYGTVKLTQLGAGTVADPYHVQVEVNLIAANNHFAGTGAGYAINWNITGDPSLTTTKIATSNTPPAPPPVAGQIYNTSHFAIQDNTVTGKHYKASPFGDSWMYAIDYAQGGGGVTNDNRLIFDVK